jgi:probable addiction module antidote protein
MREDNPLGLKPFDAAAYLTDELTVAEYLNAAAEIGDPAVLLDAFAAVGRARGMAELAKKAGLGRESLYKALAPGAHPRYDTIFKVAQALGVSFHFTASEPPAPYKAVRSSERKKASGPAAGKKAAAQAPHADRTATSGRR